MAEIHKLCAHYIECSYNADDDPVPEGELVIPKIVLTGESAALFMGIPSFNYCNIATVAEVVDTDELDKASETLKAQFPGLPGRYLEQMIVRTSVAATTLQAGTTVRIYVNSDNARLQLVRDELKLVNIWQDFNPTNMRN